MKRDISLLLGSPEGRAFSCNTSRRLSLPGGARVIALAFALVACDKKPSGGTSGAVAAASAAPSLSADGSAAEVADSGSATTADASAANAQLPAAIAYRRYVNPRFAFGVDVPSFMHEEEPPTNGDGQSFTFGDALTIRAWGMFAMEPLEAAYRADAARPEVTYKTKSKNGYIVSGVTKEADGSERVFYKRSIFAADTMKVVELEYARRLQASMDPVVARVAGSLASTGGVGP